MRTHRALRALTETVKTYQPRHWTFDSSKVAYFDTETVREWDELYVAFDVLTESHARNRDTDELHVNEWEWHDWTIRVSMPRGAPTGYEATA